MIRRMTTAAAAAALALTSISGAALAQPGHDRGGPPGHEEQGHGAPDHGGPPGQDHGAPAGYDRSGPPGHGYDHPPGHAYGHDKWRKGQRIGRNEWRGYERVDWRRHHLRPPPRGYEWREVDGDYVLAAAATGLILSIIVASH